MPPRPRLQFARRTLDELTIEDERSFRRVELYEDLKEILRRDAYSFRILPRGAAGASWDRALFLNLTFWGADQGGDILVDARIPGDVVAHVAWHRLAAKAFVRRPGERPSAGALFVGESIASAFDLYLLGRSLRHGSTSSFVTTQVPAMAAAAAAAGLGKSEFKALLERIALDPEGAFASLRELLADATAALFACKDADAALVVLARFDAHRFAPILHHYELANWVLYARAYGRPDPDPRSRAVERALRGARDPLRWLVDAWIRPALTAAPSGRRRPGGAVVRTGA